MPLNIVLLEPEMPANTGNIGRTCVATGTVLHLIEPLGFHLDDRSIKRAGMDYWEKLDVRRYINFEDFKEKNPGAKIYMATTKARKVYIEAEYEENMPEFRLRLQAKAGLTGYAQVHGRYNTTPYDKLLLDLTYIQHFSFFLDFKILMMTFKIVFMKESTEGFKSETETNERKDRK